MGSVPNKPNITKVNPKPNLNCVEVHWNAGSKKGSAAKYILEWREKDKRMRWVESEVSNDYESATTNRVVRDLKKLGSRCYQFRVRAINHVGKGPWSGIVDCIPPELANNGNENECKQAQKSL